MQWLRDESGLEVVSLADGVHRLNAGTLPGTAVAVTFDDGYLETLTDAAPILQKYAIPFTTFIASDYLAAPPRQGQYLDRKTARALADVPGSTIGAHGHTHRPLTSLDVATLDDELHRSRSALADVLGMPPFAISYPYGDVDRRVMERVQATGFTIGATSLAGVNRAGTPALGLYRTEITGPDTVSDFRGKVRGDYDWYRFKQWLYWPAPSDWATAVHKR